MDNGKPDGIRSSKGALHTHHYVIRGFMEWLHGASNSGNYIRIAKATKSFRSKGIVLRAISEMR